MTINVVEKIDGLVTVRNVLISVSNKKGLESFVPSLIDLCPGLQIFSTGGTFNWIKKILLDNNELPKNHLMQVSEYTGQPETQGGLVKTLDFKIYLGLLTETYNESHQQDMLRTEAVTIDMVVCNLYPFTETIAKEGVTVERARGNIDIGGPCMIRASAKNFIRVAVVVQSKSYGYILGEMEKNKGYISLATRYELALKAFEHTAVYDRRIADFLASKRISDVKSCYQIN